MKLSNQNLKLRITFYLVKCFLFTIKKYFRFVFSIFIFSLFLHFSSLSQNSSIYSQASLAEKIYLQLDSKVYTTDKTIWFKAIVVHASDHAPTTLSGILHVELINEQGNLVDTKLLKIKKGVGEGVFDLVQSYSEGLYLIRAYTEWNKNFGTDFIFEEYIHVFAASKKEKIDPVSNISIVEKSDNKSQLKANIDPFMLDQLHTNELTLYIALDDKKDTLSIKSNKDNKYIVDYEVPTNCQFVTFQVKTKNFHRYTKTIVLNENYLDLQFFPESGELVHGIQSLVGFKALDYNGKGKSVEGEIIDNEGKVVSSFKSNQLGMGSFFLSNVDSSITYSARLKSKSEDGLSLIYPLPEVAPRGNTLAVFPKEKEILVVASSNYIKNESIYIRACCRGVIYYNLKANLKKGEMVLSFPVDKFPEGIISFTMMDSLTNPIAERLYFNERLDDRINIELLADKKSYKQRELTELNIKTTNNENKPVQSNLSILVLNKEQMGQMQSMRQNILSYFLLSSDLKGEIEDPGFYFREGDDSRGYHLDALMLTQGWRKYRYTKPVDKVVFEPETKLSVSGVADGIISLKKNNEIILTMMTFGNPPTFGKQTADSDGHFRFYLEDKYGDNLGLVIQSAKNSGKKKNYRITLDKQEIPAFAFNHEKLIEEVDNSVQKLVEKNIERKKVEDAFPLSAGEIRLEEVVVEGYRITPQRKKVNEQFGEPDKVIHNKTIMEKEKDWSYGLFSALMSNYTDDLIISRDDNNDLQIGVVGSRHTLVMVDGEPILGYDYTYLQDIPTSEVSSVEILKNPSNFGKLYRGVHVKAGTKTGLETSSEVGLGDVDLIIPDHGSIVAIYTHGGRGLLGLRKPKGVMHTVIPVFSTPREFYVPKYENIKPDDWYKPDLRALVFWDPKIDGDNSGSTFSTFYNADNIGEMQVVVEAISENGQIGYQELIYEVEKR